MLERSARVYRCHKNTLSNRTTATGAPPVPSRSRSFSAQSASMKPVSDHGKVERLPPKSVISHYIHCLQSQACSNSQHIASTVSWEVPTPQDYRNASILDRVEANPNIRNIEHEAFYHLRRSKFCGSHSCCSVSVFCSKYRQCAIDGRYGY